MNQIHPDASLTKILDRIVASGFHYHLFTAPSSGLGLATVLGDFTEMGGGTGYATVSVVAGDFTTEGVTSHQGYITAGDISFAVTSGSSNIYGYYVTDSGNTQLIAFGVFDGGPLVLDVANPITLTPKFGNNSKYTS